MRSRSRWWPVAIALLTAGSAAAQPFPTVTPFPLEIKRAPATFRAPDAAALSVEFERLVRKAGTEVPDSAQYEQALKDLKRQDCDRDDECLKQLAQLARTLYALYVEVDNTLKGEVVASGRVVRADGTAMSPSKVVSLPLGKQRFSEVAPQAIEALLSALGLGQLPPQRTVQPEPAPVATVVSPPPPAPPSPHTLRRYAVIPGVVAGASAITAGITYGLAFSLHQQLTHDDWPAGSDPVGAAQRGQSLQVASAICTGVALAATAVLIYFLTATSGDASLVSSSATGPNGFRSFTW